jgi:predicted P-loop ATPase
MSPLPFLCADDTKLLTIDSAITPAIIAGRGYRTLEHPDEVTALGFSKAQSRTVPVLAIPLWDVQGVQTLCQIRPHAPRMLTSNGHAKPAKYECPPKSRLYLDVHPDCRAALGDPSIPLWLTEGIRKSDALLAAGAGCVIGFATGVWGWKGTNVHGGKVILPDWQHVALNGREVCVAFDSDLALKPDVQAALDGLWAFLRSKAALPARVQWPDAYTMRKWGVDDFFASGKTLADLQAMIPPRGPLPATPPAHPAPPAWQQSLLTTKSGEIKETFPNLVVALEHVAPWSTDTWYDVVREMPMVGTQPLSDAVVGDVALTLGIDQRIPIRNLKLVQNALVQLCRTRQRDLLQEWLAAMPPWDGEKRLSTWLSDCAHTVNDAYGQDVSRLIPVGMVARALKPGCQFRYVAILEGPEDCGKSKLVKALATPEWYRELSHGLEGKEAHMILQGVWVAELAELSSLGRTADARLKSFITMESDDYIPKYSNLSVARQRRTIFIGTVNPDGDGTYLRSQSGNTRFLPIRVDDIQVADFEAQREQLFAEALDYYRTHPDDWWQLSPEGEQQAGAMRDERRQNSVYEDSLRDWLENKAVGSKTETTWEEIAEHYLHLEAKEKWKDKGLQMEIAKALHALGWTRKQVRVGKVNTKRWRPPCPV